ncbi:hypothetical protein GGU10DRAFT_344908 [Lentinula aff. detonsa]|uniref:Uncharacterized protein n=1 Tax=Lentinula aff. detonsa TaxID=2804958 RepID=A0AA38KT87_9AGAR|nr:hypothetical protein GGU10DRAFT_344908 [Lentinula aff. detonsa]
MEIDHYYTQRDIISSPQHTVSAPPTRARGSVTAPDATSMRKPSIIYCELLGSDDEAEEGNGEDDHAQRFDSLDLSPHNMTIPIPKLRKIVGTRRVVSAQNAKMMRGQVLAMWKAGGLDPACHADTSSPTSVFQSITAAPSLTGTSFEELRAECYAQSKIATGGPPPPAIPISVNALGTCQPARSIPPTFQPRLVPDKTHAATYPNDVEMSNA